MAAYTSDQPAFTTTTSTTFNANFTLYNSYPYFINIVSQTYTLLLKQYFSDAPLNITLTNKLTTSTNLQAYTTYPKTP